MTLINVGEPVVDGNSIHIPIEPHGVANRFIREDYMSRYDADISEVPDSILTLPAICNVLPIAWAADAQIHVSEVDTRFNTAVDAIRGGFNEMYPDLRSDRMLVPERTVSNPADGEGMAMLFSGGVDSLTTYIRNRDEEPTLITLHGADISPENQGAWRRVKSSVEDFAKRENVDYTTITANLKQMLDMPLLHSYYGDYISNGWWGGVQHGLAMLGACAPYAQTQQIGTICIAATHTEDFSQAWGSHPSIDNNVAWGSTTVQHDGYDQSRQEKITTISEYVRATGSQPAIRSCYQSEAGKNCNRCEKCCRTISGLELAGLDPENHGYEISEDTFAHMRQQLEAGSWPIDRDEEYMWRDIQRHLPGTPVHEAAEPFFSWLERADTTDLRRRAQSMDYKNIIRPYVKYVPDPLYRQIVGVLRG